MSKRLIINADDFGYAEGSVPATIALHEAGIVTSTTALVNQPHWPEAAAYLRDHPGLGAGVHLVMNDGHPILLPEQVGSLVDADGCFRDGMPLLLRYGRLRTDELKAEWRAQIEKFIADTTRPPDHLDLHCYYPYVFPAWFRVSLELAQEYGHLPVRMPFWQGRRYQRLVERYGLKQPHYFEMSFSQGRHRTAEHLLGLLDALPDGITELLAHPGTEGWREGDYRALLDPRVRQRIVESGIALISYDDLKQVTVSGSNVSPA